MGIVSQEILNPLTSIKGAAATLMGSSTDSSGSRPLLRIIDHHAGRIGDLLTSLQDLNLIEAGLISVDTKPLDAAALIEEATQEFLRGGGRSIITVDATQPLPLVMAERRRIIQVLTILLRNAAAHSPDWSTVAVKASPLDWRMEISVTDSGIGIPPGQLPYVFRKYHQVQPDHLDSGKFSGKFREGLGLAICRGIIEAHGGRIWVESDGLGHGAKFTFTLPFADETETQSAPTTGRLPSDVQTGAGEQARILTVADDPLVLRLVRSALLENGYTPVVTCRPG